MDLETGEKRRSVIELTERNRRHASINASLDATLPAHRNRFQDPVTPTSLTVVKTITCPAAFINRLSLSDYMQRGHSLQRSVQTSRGAQKPRIQRSGAELLALLVQARSSFGMARAGVGGIKLLTFRGLPSSWLHC